MTAPAGSGRPAVSIVHGPDDMAASAAAFIVDALAAAIRARGVAHWCTTGGSSAPGIYRALRSAPLRDALDWTRVHTWWGDDRFVAPGDPLCNATPFERVLRDPDAGLVIPDANVHPVPVAPVLAAGGGPADAAAAYAAELAAAGPAPAGLPADALPLDPVRAAPAFDLILVGIGPDGHVLSVFPWSAVFDAEPMVLDVPAPTHIEPHLPRVTLHPRLLLTARSVLAATAGSAKADAVARAWGGGDVRELPLRLLVREGATWLLDEAAAAGLR